MLHPFDNFVSRLTNNKNELETLESKGKTNASSTPVKSLPTCTLAVKSITSHAYLDIVPVKVVYTDALLNTGSDRSFANGGLLMPLN